MKKTIQITAILLFSAATIFSQTRETKKADTYFKNLSYIAASEEYAKLAEENPSEYILRQLGDSYYYNVEMQKAFDAYQKLFASFPDQDAEHLFRYAQTLRSTGDFEASQQWMKKLNAKYKSDTRGINFTENTVSLSDLKDGKPNYTVENLKSINTEESDFGVTEYGNTILFSSPRADSDLVKRNYTRNNQNFLDIYKVLKENLSSGEDAKSEKKPLFVDVVNSKYHESSVAFSLDKKTMYFTRNNFIDGNYGKDKNGINNLKLYKATWIDIKWDNIEELPFNSDEYSVGHPSVSRDGTQLFFVSDMPGGLGKTDIYVSKINTDGSFGEPQNLGTKINTEGREMFPFISNDDILYFSSDGHFGIGALDIFESENIEGSYTNPVNLKAPINSKLDDFAFSINPETQKGYLSSNREGGLGDDDIYTITQLKPRKKEEPKPCLQEISGIVRDKKFKNPLANSRLVLKNDEGTIVKDTIVGKQGKFIFKLPCNENFTITASKEYYKPKSATFSTTKSQKLALDLDFGLEIVDEFTYNDKNELIIKIKPIYFDSNKSNIRPDASEQLNIVVASMQKYPKIEVRGSSHTDAKGRFAYNEKLSSRRAKSTIDYLISKGISASRLVAKGFGETQLTNNCVDNDNHSNRVKCTKEQHQKNRRTEFVITKM